MKKKMTVSVSDIANSLGHINEKKLFAHLNNTTVETLFKSDKRTHAQYETLLKNCNDQSVNLSSILSKLERIKKSDKLLYYIAMIQFASGARISEVLNIKPSDITRSGSFRLSGMKNSKSNVYFVEAAYSYLLACKKNNVHPFALYSRFYCYRQYRKYGISYITAGNKVKSVTHAFRHINAALQRDENFDNDSIQSFLRHKSSKSTTYYGRSKKN